MAAPGKPTFFSTPGAFGAWLAKNGAKRTELIVGYWKVGSGKPSMTWAESVVEAIAHGWIDGVRHSLGAEAYTIRFTPRKPTSIWSNINVATARRLVAEGRMAPAGLAAFERRNAKRTGIYSAEQPRAELRPDEEDALRADAKAWAWFSASPPSYRKAARWWVASAKRPGTRARRLSDLLASSRRGTTVKPLTRPGKG